MGIREKSIIRSPNTARAHSWDAAPDDIMFRPPIYTVSIRLSARKEEEGGGGRQRRGVVGEIERGERERDRGGRQRQRERESACARKKERKNSSFRRW